MPKKFRKKVYKIKKRFTNYKRKKPNFTAVGLPLGTPIMTKAPGFPRNRIARLNFVWRFDDSGGSTPNYFRNFVANSIWQCEDGIGVNANAFAIWQQFYNRCCVLKTNIEVSFSMNGGSHVPAIVILHLDNSQNYPSGTDLQDWMEMRNTTYRLCQPSENAPMVHKLKLSYTAKSFNSLTSIPDSSNQCQVIGLGPGPSYPPIKNYFRITVTSQDGTTNLAASFVTAKISYLVYFMEPNDVISDIIT